MKIEKAVKINIFNIKLYENVQNTILNKKLFYYEVWKPFLFATEIIFWSRPEKKFEIFPK